MVMELAWTFVHRNQPLVLQWFGIILNIVTFAPRVFTLVDEFGFCRKFHIQKVSTTVLFGYFLFFSLKSLLFVPSAKQYTSCSPPPPHKASCASFLKTACRLHL